MISEGLDTLKNMASDMNEVSYITYIVLMPPASLLRDPQFN